MPAITIGRRHYKINSKIWDSYNYIDVQLSIEYAGAGTGIISIGNERFYKYKMYAGSLAMVFYD